MTDSPNGKKFIREKVVKPKKTGRQVAGKIFCLFLFAVIFGVVAAVTFVVSKPLAEKYLGEETEPSTVPITIERDEEETTEAAMETMEATAPEPSSEQEPNMEEIREIVRDEIKQDTWTAEKIKAFNQAVIEIGVGAERSIVIVSSEKYEKDWFDNPLVNTGRYAGMIIASNPGEIVILTGATAVEEADSVEIIFGDGSMAGGTVKALDTVFDTAVVTVNAEELTETTKNWISTVELGNSYSVNAGDLLVAVGSPAGRVYSVKHGNVSCIVKNVQAMDGQTRVFLSDIPCDIEKGTFFLNLSGQLVGWATDLFELEDTEGMTMIMSLSEYKGSLQKLSNGIPVPYLGIMGQEVNAYMQKEGVPVGIYITESIAGGPAYQAGIQNGDILTEIRGTEIRTFRDFQSCLESLQSEMEVTIVVQRKGIDAYKEIEYQVTIGAR